MTEARNTRKTYQGRVVSDKMDKTVTVAINTYKNHPVYGKRVKYTKSLRLTMRTTKLRQVIWYVSWRRAQRQLQSASVW